MILADYQTLSNDHDYEPYYTIITSLLEKLRLRGEIDTQCFCPHSITMNEHYRVIEIIMACQDCIQNDRFIQSLHSETRYKYDKVLGFGFFPILLYLLDKEHYISHSAQLYEQLFSDGNNYQFPGFDYLSASLRQFIIIQPTHQQQNNLDPPMAKVITYKLSKCRVLAVNPRNGLLIDYYKKIDSFDTISEIFKKFADTLQQGIITGSLNIPYVCPHNLFVGDDDNGCFELQVIHVYSKCDCRHKDSLIKSLGALVHFLFFKQIYPDQNNVNQYQDKYPWVYQIMKNILDGKVEIIDLQDMIRIIPKKVESQIAILTLSQQIAVAGLQQNIFSQDDIRIKGTTALQQANFDFMFYQLAFLQMTRSEAIIQLIYNGENLMMFYILSFALKMIELQIIKEIENKLISLQTPQFTQGQRDYLLNAQRSSMEYLQSQKAKLDQLDLNSKFNNYGTQVERILQYYPERISTFRLKDYQDLLYKQFDGFTKKPYLYLFRIQCCMKMPQSLQLPGIKQTLQPYLTKTNYKDGVKPYKFEEYLTKVNDEQLLIDLEFHMRTLFNEQ